MLENSITITFFKNNHLQLQLQNNKSEIACFYVSIFIHIYSKKRVVFTAFYILKLCFIQELHAIFCSTE